MAKHGGLRFVIDDATRQLRCHGHCCGGGRGGDDVATVYAYVFVRVAVTYVCK